MIHGSSDGMFNITVCADERFKNDMLSVGYNWDVPRERAGAYVIDEPASRLWAWREGGSA